MQIFEEVIFFKLRTTTKNKNKTTTTEKQTIHSAYLVSVGCRRLAEGEGHETDSSKKCARFVLFRLIKKCSFNFLCDLDIFFFRMLAVNFVSDFNFFIPWLILGF